MESSWLRVTVAYCAPGVEDISEVRVASGSSVGDALEAAQIFARRPELKHAPDTGIWSRRCALDELLKEGDRVEIYRPLQISPKEARRRRAAV